jgi:hypothetical protein
MPSAVARTHAPYTGSIADHLFVFSACCACILATQSVAADEPWPEDLELALEISDEFSPFALVKYELRQTAAGSTLTLARSYHGSFREDTGLSLLSASQLASFRSKLGQCGSLPTLAELARVAEDKKSKEDQENKKENEPTYRIQWRTDGAVFGYTVSADVIRNEAISWCVVRVIQDEAAEHLDAIPFEMVFIAEGEVGYVDIVTRPPAKVWIDGFPVAGLSPLWRHPVVAGVKRVRIEEASLGVEQAFELLVEPGGTTAIELDLLR